MVTTHTHDLIIRHNIKLFYAVCREAIHVPFMARFVVYAKRTDECQAQLRMFCVTDDKEDKALERVERFIQVAKSKDVEVSKTQIHGVVHHAALLNCLN